VLSHAKPKDLTREAELDARHPALAAVTS